jgi:hypothetical protein
MAHPRDAPEQESQAGDWNHLFWRLFRVKWLVEGRVFRSFEFHAASFFLCLQIGILALCVLAAHIYMSAVPPISLSSFYFLPRLSTKSTQITTISTTTRIDIFE